MNRRQFTRTVLTGGVSLFLPKLIAPQWKPLKRSFEKDLPPSSLRFWWIMEGEKTAIFQFGPRSPGLGWREFKPLKNNLPETGDFVSFLREKYQPKNQT